MRMWPPDRRSQARRLALVIPSALPSESMPLDVMILSDRGVECRRWLAMVIADAATDCRSSMRCDDSRRTRRRCGTSTLNHRGCCNQ